jgi:hypothetical protein
LRDGQFSPYSSTVSITTNDRLITAPPTITNVTTSGSNVTFTLINTDNNAATLFADFSTGATQRALLVGSNASRTFTLAFTGTDNTIFAKAKGGFKGDSAVVSVQFAADDPPATPSITSTVTNVGNTVINWSYTGPIVDGFYILRNPTLQNANNFDVLIGNISPRIFRFTDFNVGSGISYQYKVVAFNRIAQAESSISTVTTTTMTPTPPSLLTVSEVGIVSAEGDILLQLNWQSNSAGAEDGFNIKIGSNIVGGAVSRVTNANVTVNVPTGETIEFNFTVIAFNQFGESAASNTASITITG